MDCLLTLKDRIWNDTTVRDIRRQEQKIDPKDFIIDGVEGGTIGRTPGTINGQQFIIQNCKNANIYLFDHSATITVDDCENCRIFMGPIQSSVFIRDCHDCKIMVACQQFRTRDCKKLDVFLSCVTQPIIEASTGLKFGCFQCWYPELEEQFRRAKVSVYNNNWSSIHDFTPVNGETNYSLINENTSLEECFPFPTTDEFSVVELSYDRSRSVVPSTLGTRRKPSDESCLVVFFHDGNDDAKVKDFSSNLKSQNPACVLVQTKEIQMSPDEAIRVFNTDAYSTAVGRGPAIGLEFNGENVLRACQDTMKGITKGNQELGFVSNNPAQAAQQIDDFYNYAEMQMAV